MLVRTTCAIDEHVFFITVGDSCFYLVKCSTGIHLIDTGSGIHVPQLLKRLAELEINPQAISSIYLSNDNPARISGLPYLLKHTPHAKVFCVNELAAELNEQSTWERLFQADREISALYSKTRCEPIGLKEYLDALKPCISFPDNETIIAGSGITLRIYQTPGHSKFSTSFFLPDLQLLISDQTFGYFRGKEPPAPGANFSIEAAATARSSIKDLQVESLAFHMVGFISGSLAQKHLSDINQASQSLVSECKNATIAGVPDSGILESLTESVYTSAFRDPIIQWQMNHSRDAIWAQIQAILKQ